MLHICIVYHNKNKQIDKQIKERQHMLLILCDERVFYLCALLSKNPQPQSNHEKKSDITS